MPQETLIQQKLLFDGKSIKQEKDGVKENNRAKGKEKEGFF